MTTTEKKSAAAATTPRYETGPIVVGSDGSPGGDDAVALAHDLAGTSSRKLIAEKVPDVAIPSMGLVGLAIREDAGTLVVGSPHRGRVGRALLGSVAHHVLHHAPCEVVVAPRGYAGRERHPRLAEIAVAFDGTPEARTALRRAEALARDTGASLRLIVAEDPVVAGLQGPGTTAQTPTDAAEVLREALDSVAPSIEATGSVLDPAWRQGDKSIAGAIAETCERDVDILVVGSRKPLDRLVVGSISGLLIDIAPCAVLVVPHEEEAGSARAEEPISETDSPTDAAPRHKSGRGPVVVGVDGTEGGLDAVALARDLGGGTRRRCVLAVADLYGPASVTSEPTPRINPVVVPQLAQAHREVGGENSEDHVVGHRPPAMVLLECVHAQYAGTLVVGSPHRGRVGRALLGSVAHHVLHRAPCEVVVAPRGYRSRKRRGITKIAVAYDGTGESRTALRRAEDLARETGASLHLIVAEDPVVAGVESKQEFTPLTNAPAVLEAGLRSVDPSLEADGTHIHPGWRKVHKSVAEAIAKECDDEVDILVAGTRRPLDRLLMGSVTGHLIDVAPCAVLVVPHEEGA